MKRKCIRIAVLLAVLAFAVWMVWGNTTVGITHYAVKSRRLPAAFNGFKIAVVSDFHNAQYGNDNAGLLADIRAQQPDIIAITGDFVDCHRTDFGVAERFAKGLVEIAPCYYVLGNHETWIGEGKESYEQAMKAAGVMILRNAFVPLKRNGETLQIIGLDDPDFGDTNFALQKELVSMPLMDDYSILLSHRPEMFEVYSAENMDLALCGHAHGGQVRLPFIGGLFAPNQGLFPKYDAGMFTEKNTTMIISRGIGNSSFPVRFNNRPEILIVRLFSEA
jgi:Predicted phosphohydrolases